MKQLILIIALTLSIYITNAQTTSLELISSAGESFNNTTYQLDWSIGEIQTETFTVSQNILTQGFHQGTYIVTEIEQLSTFDFDIIAYPNPTTDLITIEWNIIPENENIESFLILNDLSGKVLKTEKFTDNNHQINFSNYAIGTYFLIIQQNNEVVKSFKIIKQ